MDALHGKHLLIIGLARQGVALAKFAISVGAKVTISDKRSPATLKKELEQLAHLDIRYVLGKHPFSLLDSIDFIAPSGGVPLDTPLLQEAHKRGIPFTNDTLEFSRRVKARTIGITGSAGKTTTTSLLGLMCQLTSTKSWIGGNIGYPLIDHLNDIETNHYVVQELSSFQLDLWDRSPPVALLLNITPNHLDRHKTLQQYIQAKANILRHQYKEDVAILGADDEQTMRLQPLIKGRLRLFSTQQPVTDGAYVHQDKIWLVSPNTPSTQVCDLSDIRLQGTHNVQNVVAAVAAADTVGIPIKTMQEAIIQFTGVAHRLEMIQEINGVTYINDSIATAPERAIAGINSFIEPIILLAGGRDKEMVWEQWAQVVQEQVKAVILFGELSSFLEQKLKEVRSDKKAQVICRQTLEEAVQTAQQLAVNGDIVLLSPGGTSFDAFQNFAERGEQFRVLVQKLDKE